MNSKWESQLKSARSSKGLSLEECSDLTKIPISFLVSLENGDFSSLPAKIYSEFHIKNIFLFWVLIQKHVFKNTVLLFQN